MQTVSVNDVMGSMFGRASNSAGAITVRGNTVPIVVTGRATQLVNGMTLTTTLPAIPSTAGITSTQTKRFTGISDASPATIASRTAGASRSSLGLLETSGQAATVRVTLRFNFSSGSSVLSAKVEASKLFDVRGDQLLMIDDLVRHIVGPSRSEIGDLHNIQVDVEVTGGNGRIVPFLRSIESRTGDVLIRTD